jgi:hypothetical protein
MTLFARKASADLQAKAEWLDVLSRHSGVGLWDAVLHAGDAAHPQSRWTWSPEFRRLCGFRDESDFPNQMTAWSDRLHPDDVAPTFAAFGKALETGGLYDTTYRLKVKDGSYRWFRATGGVIREGGVARRACGSLVDIHASRQADAERRQATETLSRRFETEVQGVMADVASAAAALQKDASAMAGATGHTHQRAGAAVTASDEARQNVQSVAAATEQVSASIQEITQQVTRSTQATGSARSGIGSAMEAVRGLIEDVRRIGDVVNLISNVAGQTNLLALNATIEAARAGEAGKGFAVVASEVKALAGQTAKATDEIAGRIHAIQGATESVELAFSGVATTVDQLNEVAAAIAAAVEEQHATIAEIARSIHHAADRTQEVTASIGEVNRLATDAGAVSGRITGAAGALAEQVGGVRQKVDGFLVELRAA